MLKATDVGLVDKRTGQMVSVCPHEQIAKPKMMALGDLPVGATFHHDGQLWKKIQDGGLTDQCLVMRMGRGKVAKPALPYYLLVII